MRRACPLVVIGSLAIFATGCVSADRLKAAEVRAETAEERARASETESRRWYTAWKDADEVSAEIVKNRNNAKKLEREREGRDHERITQFIAQSADRLQRAEAEKADLQSELSQARDDLARLRNELSQAKSEVARLEQAVASRPTKTAELSPTASSVPSVLPERSSEVRRVPCAECGRETASRPDGAGESLCSKCDALYDERNRRFTQQIESKTAYTCTFCGARAPDGGGMCPSCIAELGKQLRRK